MTISSQPAVLSEDGLVGLLLGKGPPTISDETMRAVEGAWGVELAEPVRRFMREKFVEAVTHARWARADTAKPAPDRKDQRKLQTRSAELAIHQIVLLREMQHVGPLHTCLAMEFDISACIDNLRALVKAARRCADATRQKPSRGRGRPSEAWLNELIIALWVTYEGSGGIPSAAWRTTVGNRLTPFVRGISALVADLPSDVPAPPAKAIGERVHKLKRKLSNAAAGQKSKLRVQ